MKRKTKELQADHYNAQRFKTMRLKKNSKEIDNLKDKDNKLLEQSSESDGEQRPAALDDSICQAEEEDQEYMQGQE